LSNFQIFTFANSHMHKLLNFAQQTPPMSIEVKGLTKIYGAQKAVDHISFSLNKGEIVGFLGPNGAGKSTTMKIITGYLQQSEGETFVCGTNVKAQPIETKKKIGYLPEANPLYYDMYVKEYLGFVADVHSVGGQRSSVINKIINLVGLTPESKKKIGQLSKGYKQRVGLAAALIHEPEVLILDEPTSGLDPNQIIEIRQVIKNLGKDKTVLFSSHILQEVEAICNRVIIINKGKIVADDQLGNLQNANKNNHVVLVQFKENVDIELLKNLNEVTNAGQLATGNWKLETPNPESVRKQLMQLSLQHNLNIVSLQSGEQSLEEVFRSLTNKDEVE
jgi:ABC-2 type transport system ATP-binding protein